MTDELQLSLPEMMRITATGGNGAELVNIAEMLNEAAARIEALEAENARLATKQEAVRRTLRTAGAHQMWCGLFGEMIGWGDDEIAELEPFMLAYFARLREDLATAP